MSKPLHSPQYQQFVAELRALRERAGVTQAVLADALGEPQTFVSKCETGVRRLDVIELRAWLQALGVDLAEFAKHLEQRLAQHTMHGAVKLGRKPGRLRN